MDNNLPEKVFLFGHRAAHGKDESCNIVEEILAKRKIKCFRNSFAKSLKQFAANKYMLDFTRMNDFDYKNYKPDHLNGLTVREVLIHEGNTSRQIWLHTWAWACFSEILESGCKIGLVSDFRFPNEYLNFEELVHKFIDNKTNSVDYNIPKLIKVQIHMPEGTFNNDGADGELPDDFDFWDYTIINHKNSKEWRSNLFKELEKILEEENVI